MLKAGEERQVPAMPMIDRTDDELDPATVLADDDRIRAEAAAERPISRSSEHATAGRDALIYRRRDNARLDSAGYAAVSPVFGGDDGVGRDAYEVSEFDAYTMGLVEAVGDALGITRIDLRREWEATDAKVLDRVCDLERELKTLTAIVWLHRRPGLHCYGRLYLCVGQIHRGRGGGDA